MVNTTSSSVGSIRRSTSFKIAQLAFAHRRLADSLLREIGLHVGQEMLMNALWEQGAMSQTEIANRLGVKPSTITVSLKSLEKAGFVTRERDIDDQRIVRVNTTKEGTALQKPVHAVWSRLEDRTLTGLSRADAKELDRLLSKVVSQLEH